MVKAKMNPWQLQLIFFLIVFILPSLQTIKILVEDEKQPPPQRLSRVLNTPGLIGLLVSG